MKVKFRRYPDGEVIALFPDETWNGREITSYMQVGQHAGADYWGVIEQTRPADRREYQSLYRELLAIGYKDLEVSTSLTAEEKECYKKHMLRQRANELGVIILAFKDEYYSKELMAVAVQETTRYDGVPLFSFGRLTYDANHHSITYVQQGCYSTTDEKEVRLRAYKFFGIK